MRAILCFGDSITEGRGELPNTGWVGRLKESFESADEYNVVYNLGIPGETTDGLLKRFKIECAARVRNLRPEDRFVILVAIGINDSLWFGLPKSGRPCTTPERFEKNVQRLIEIGSSFEAELAFIGLTPVDESRTMPYEETSLENKRVKEYNARIKKCCAEKRVPFLDLFESMSKLMSDI